MRKTSLYILLVAFIALPSSAAIANGLNRLLTYMIIAQEYSLKCLDGIPIGLTKNFELIQNKVVDLSKENNPEMSLQQIRDWLRATIEKRATLNMQKMGITDCKGKQHEKLLKTINHFSSEKALERIKVLISTPLPYEKKMPLPYSSNNSASFAYEHLYPIFWNTISRFWNGNDTEEKCRKFDVISVSATSTSVPKHASQPLFIKGPTKYTETWQTECNGRTKHIQVQFTQTSDGGVGVYSVKETN